jgi:hypothetical protein
MASEDTEDRKGGGKFAERRLFCVKYIYVKYH